MKNRQEERVNSKDDCSTAKRKGVDDCLEKAQQSAASDTHDERVRIGSVDAWDDG